MTYSIMQRYRDLGENDWWDVGGYTSMKAAKEEIDLMVSGGLACRKDLRVCVSGDSASETYLAMARFNGANV